MDNHLNIFQAYHSGNQDSPDKINRLEDNLTRVFIITLKYLQEYNEDTFRCYLKNLIGKITVSSHLSFDLQNMTDGNVLKQIQKSKNKWVLLISRDPYTFEWNSRDKERFKKLKPLLVIDDGEIKDTYKKERDDLLKKLKDSFKANKDCWWGDNKISAKEVSSFYTLLHSCRPDGWIYDGVSTSSPLSVLIEAKVGNNQFSRDQIYRHLSGKLGYNLGIKAEGFDDQNHIVSVTWGEVLQSFESLKINQETFAGEILRQFKEYMAMSGEIMDLRKLNDNYDNDFAKIQFDLFLNKLDEVIKQEKLPLVRKNRPKDGLWDIYGIQDEDGKPLENPNFTIGFGREGVGCSLTANKKRKFLLNEKLRCFLEKIATNTDYEPRQRYRYILQRNRLVDWQNGQQRGEKYLAFSFFVNFAEKQWQSRESISELIDINNTCMKKGGQEQMLAWSVDWVNSTKAEDHNRETPLRSANLELFENPDKLFEQIVAFFKELYPVLLEMHTL